MRRSVFSCACIVMILSAATANADTVTIGASKDAAIYAGTVNNSNGAGPGMFAGTDTGPNRIRSLIAFDIAGVPQLSGATITNVQLLLGLGMVPGGSPPAPSPETIDLRRL